MKNHRTVKYKQKTCLIDVVEMKQGICSMALPPSGTFVGLTEIYDKPFQNVCSGCTEQPNFATQHLIFAKRPLPCPKDFLSLPFRVLNL